MATEKEILDSLRHIIDPDLGRDIVTLGFVKNLSIEGGNVDFDLELTTPACPVKEHFRAQAEEAVGKLPGVDRVTVRMTAQARQARPQPQTDNLAEVDAVIAVSSCKGGVGKSTVAAHLARAIQREGHSVGLVDVDIFGPSFPTLFRIYYPEVQMQGECIEPVVVDGLKTMSMGYLMGDSPAVMRGPMASNYAIQILRQTNWGKLDYLIIDLPPGTSDIQLTLVQQASIDGAVIVTTPQALSLVDVARGILMFEKVNVPVLGMVENMASYVCDGCNKEHFPFGTGADSLKDRFGLATLARLPIMAGISDTSSKDAGADIEAFSVLADHLHREVGKRRAGLSDQPEARAEAGCVVVRWPDGSESSIPNRELRASCRCALCVDEYSREELIDVDAIPGDIAVVELQPLGNYAVSIAWSDGHSSGIYAWDHLRAVAGDCATT